MSHSHNAIPPELLFYASAPHPCSYLEGREAVTLFADPEAKMSTALYSALSELGFRRSGEYVYAPRCPACSACLPARIPVSQFHPNRSQRRSWKKNSDLSATVLPAEFRQEHFALYQAYVNSRHPDGSMATPDPEQYNRFFTSSWCDTRFVEFSDHTGVVAVLVMDLLANGLSAVYTFFDPEAAQRGVGVHAVLWLVEEARRRGLSYVYLGYLIHESPKMAYKANYRPLEVFRSGVWQLLEQRQD
ncbi:MAG: arginyltransferase [Gammaproteobacteria bacterium]|nr:arginyltransferase [Gammaproteobacteria bacterium]MCW8839617.1 arginyltransferase [Gammaproteobacteria bacterium]MCW8928537.1 arginyltransferase [Gammaproteobacteria bacterium]MCW8957647.1 arginyltransferase [Gammaproteobacteria bacterium]MCW8973587.1 arginyltransferase [Gammaproteobacteria bacterium]